MIGGTGNQSQSRSGANQNQQTSSVLHQSSGCNNNNNAANTNNNQSLSTSSTSTTTNTNATPTTTTTNTSHHQHLVNHRTSNANRHQDADDDYLEDNGMRVGSNYQAEIPQFIAYAPAPEYYEEEKAIKVWSPYNKIPDHVLEEFLTKAKEKFFYNMEQALGMLSWHKFDLNRAYADLPNFVPYPIEWSVEDKVLFEQAYQFHEKQFNKIRQMLPDKSMANLISYYYTWKKKRTGGSLMERQTRRFAPRKAADGNGQSDEDGDDENENEANQNDINEGQDNVRDNSDAIVGDGNIKHDEESSEDPNITCCMCNKELRVHGKNVGVIIDSPLDFCSRCYLEWKRNGCKITPKTELSDCYYQQPGETRILFSYQDVVSLIEGPGEQGDLILKHLDAQIENRRREIQNKKQKLSFIKDKIKPIEKPIAELDMNEFSDILPEYRPSKSWTPEETQLVIQGLRRYGTDFSAISDVVRTKSEEQIRLFYVSQKERLNLGLLVEDFEKTKTSSTVGSTDQLQEQISTG